MNGMTEQHIVAIDLGTSKMALTIARTSGRNAEIVYYKETPSAGVRYSGVYNSVLSLAPLSHLIKDAEDALGIQINQAVVGMPKYPVRQENNSGKVMDRGEDTEITAENIEDLKRFAQETYPLDDPQREAIYGAVAQSFSDGEYFQIIESDIVGMTSDVLEGHFKIFIGKKKELKNIDNLLTRAGISARKKYFTAETTARSVLTETEKENGVALIDFGGGSTSVTIYHDNIMRHYASIPFGGKNITNDIKSELQITERLAENIKLAFGACMPDKLQSLSEKVLHIRGNGADQDKQVSVKYLSEIITARVEEILQAILYEINESGLAEHLRSGVVVTGGGGQIANIGILINEMTGYKVRTGYPIIGISGEGIDGIHDTTAATSIGLINAALEEESMNCAIADTVFEHTPIEEEEPEAQPQIVETAEDAEYIEPEEATEEENIENEEKENGSRFSRFLKKLTSEDDEEEEEEEVEEEEEEEKEPRERWKLLKVLWGKAQRVGEVVGEKTDSLLDSITNDDEEDE